MTSARLSVRPLAPLLFALALVPLAAVGACADSTPVAARPDAGSSSDSGQPTIGDGGGAEGEPKTTCDLTRAYFEGCGNEGDLTCGAESFAAWCAANDETINSEAYRRAEERCLTQDNCDGKDRRACEYEHYDDETPTASQEALVAAYCGTCEPDDVAGCAARSTTYDPSNGIESVPDIFIAAWELADGVVDEIATKCTGTGAPGAGSDPVDCAKAFAGCAADVYLARLPDCPNR